MRTFIGTCILLLTIVVFSVPYANAGEIIFYIYIDENTDPIIVQDQGENDSNSRAGVVTFSGNEESWVNLSLTSRFTQTEDGLSIFRFGGSAYSEDPDGSSSLRIIAAQTDFFAKTNEKFALSYSGDTEGEVRGINAYYDPDNSQMYPPQSLIASTNPFAEESFSGQLYSPSKPQDDAYSLAVELTIIHPEGNKLTGFNTSIRSTPVPEPSLMILLGISLLGLGFARKLL